VEFFTAIATPQHNLGAGMQPIGARSKSSFAIWDEHTTISSVVKERGIPAYGSLRVVDFIQHVEPSN